MNPWGSRLSERLTGEDAWHLNARFLRLNLNAHIYKAIYAMQIEKGAYTGINAETLQNQQNNP
ncbi:MAG: hypothetical protein IT210_26795 [Armatimonadetes bacterium]|nr:hypothetical protein [Armatimonadota bacterium]